MKLFHLKQVLTEWIDNCLTPSSVGSMSFIQQEVVVLAGGCSRFLFLGWTGINSFPLQGRKPQISCSIIISCLLFRWFESLWQDEVCNTEDYFTLKKKRQIYNQNQGLFQVGDWGGRLQASINTFSRWCVCVCVCRNTCLGAFLHPRRSSCSSSTFLGRRSLTTSSGNHWHSTSMLLPAAQL